VVASERGPRSAATVVDEVDILRLESVIRALSGADSLIVDGAKHRIATRYTYSGDIGLARRYLLDEVRGAGYEPKLQRFVMYIDVPAFTGSALSLGGDTIWIAAAAGQVYSAALTGDWPAFTRRGSVGGEVYNLVRDGRGRLWAAGRLSGTASGGLFVSTNGGEHWDLKASGPDVYTVGTVAFGDDRFGMAAGSNGTVIRTGNGGNTWTTLDPATFGHESISGAVSTGPFHYWLISDFGFLYETSDIGATWSRRSLGNGVLNAIDFHGESTGVIVGDGIAFYTKDAGTTWMGVSVATEFTRVCMGDSLRVLAAGTGGEIWSSEDGGETWAQFGTECSVSAEVRSIVSPMADTFWLTGMDVIRRIGWESARRSCMGQQFVDTVWGENISFRHEGTLERDHCVALTAHYDSYAWVDQLICAPGADDNATGVAAVIECARALRDKRTERTIEFILFDGEEVGLKGSRFYAGALDTSLVYDGVLNIDMIGWEPEAVMTAVVSERTEEYPDSIIRNAIHAAIDSFELSLEIAVLHGERLTSDHVSFWGVGIPAVLLAEGRRAELTPYYHTCADSAGNLNYAFLEVCTKAAVGAVAILARLLPDDALPARIALHQNYPNPFNAGTTISYELPAAADVELAVYDISGRRVALIERRRRGAGAFDHAWNGADDRGERLASGVYFLRLGAGGEQAVRKIVILK
jgi:photosystem II stability/assembly factor-like uncharacterized protein